MRPHTTMRALGAGAALGVLFFFTALVTSDAPGAHPAAAQAAPSAAARSAGDVSIADRRLNVVAGRRALVRGRVGAASAGVPVALQRRRDGRWHTIDRARTAAGGAFAFSFRPRSVGSAMVRVRAGAADERVGRLNVYRRVQVSWYGPGLYGGHLGCGGTLTPDTVGVAHRSLPCGAKVTLSHGGRTVRVPVVDRGPYAGDREFDLTAGAKAKLGFSGTGTILVAD